jgi:hypothetical protein
MSICKKLDKIIFYKYSYKLFFRTFKNSVRKKALFLIAVKNLLNHSRKTPYFKIS